MDCPGILIILSKGETALSFLAILQGTLWSTRGVDKQIYGKGAHFK